VVQPLRLLQNPESKSGTEIQIRERKLKTESENRIQKPFSEIETQNQDSRRSVRLMSPSCIANMTTLV
jgi:hypothetical protein